MRLIRFLCLLAVVSLYSCIGVDEVDLSSTKHIKIELDETTKNMSSEMTLGEARHLKATYYNIHSREENVNIQWVSSDESVLKVDQDSLRAVGVGEGFAYAMFEGTISDSTNKITVTAISISVDETNILSGDPKQINLSIAASLKDKTVTWKSSDETVATIDATGKVTSLKNGTTDITATVEGFSSNTITLTVVEGFFISITNTKLTEGQTETATITTNNALKGQTVTWKSSDETIATIDSEGKISAISAGTTNITAEINSSASNSITITVEELPSRKAIFTTTTHYKTEGSAILQQTVDGKLQIIFQDDADIDNGPSLYLLLANKTDPPFTIKKDGSSLSVDNISAQITANRLPSAIKGKTVYEVPDGVKIDDYKYIVFYCTLGPVFGSAELK